MAAIAIEWRLVVRVTQAKHFNVKTWRVFLPAPKPIDGKQITPYMAKMCAFLGKFREGTERGT